jgi:hypothetical protein
MCDLVLLPARDSIAKAGEYILQELFTKIMRKLLTKLGGMRALPSPTADTFAELVSSPAERESRSRPN